MVLLNCSLPGNDFDTVMPDNRGGMVKACEKLLSIGCRNIAFLGSAPEYSRYSCNYAERLSAYLKFCRENGMKTVWENLTIPVNADRKTEETVAGILAKWEKSPVPPDAVITVNHPYGAMVSAMRPGLPVVAGDNKKLDGADAEVPFVLVQDPRAMGGFAAELLIRRINTPARRRVRLDCEVTLQDNTL